MGIRRGKAGADGEAGLGAGGQRHPDQSECGPMGSSRLLLEGISLVSEPTPGLGLVAFGQPAASWPGSVSADWLLTVYQWVKVLPTPTRWTV